MSDALTPVQPFNAILQEGLRSLAVADDAYSVNGKWALIAVLGYDRCDVCVALYEETVLRVPTKCVQEREEQ